LDPSVLRAACAYLPVFPLPDVVLMPGARLPLHVFEPRYRALVSYVLSGDQLMGVATLRPDPEASPMFPPLFPEIGMGQVLFHQQLEDGRSNIVLQYVGRAALEQELQTQFPFRVVRGRLLEEHTDGAEAEILNVRELVRHIGRFSERASTDVDRLLSLPGVDMVDELARTLITDQERRRAYLRLPQLVDRVSVVEDQLAELIVMARPPIGDA